MSVNPRLGRILSTQDLSKEWSLEPETITAAVAEGVLPVWRRTDAGHPRFAEVAVYEYLRRSGELAAERSASVASDELAPRRAS